MPRAMGTAAVWGRAIGLALLDLVPVMARGMVMPAFRNKVIIPALKAQPFLRRLGYRYRGSGAGQLSNRMVCTPRKAPLAKPGGEHTFPTGRRRFRAKFIVVYHNADRAGPHTEGYVEDPETGVAHNVGVIKDFDNSEVTFNNEGWVTQDSKEYLKDVWRAKAHSRAWIPFSTDHLGSEARETWLVRADGPDMGVYGAGSTRQVLWEEDVEVYVTDGTVHWTSWELNPRQPLYVHKVFEETNVGVIGFKQLPEPQFEDRLHLTTDGDDEAKFLRNVGADGHASEKIDGASTHFISDKNGTRFFSPRHYDKGAGPRIEYSAKLGGLQDVTSEETTKGMAEIVFVDSRTGRTLSAAETGGELNSHRLPSSHLIPKVSVYRVDQVGRNNTLHEPAWPDNRLRATRFASSHRDMSVPQEIALDSLDSTRDAEGVVGVAEGQPLIDGRKLKWREDAEDVIVTEVTFKPGPTGKVAGVVKYEDGNGRQYKTASGWTETEKQDMMAQPDEYNGRVMKISGFNGHSSRAARFESWHADKDLRNVA